MALRRSVINYTRLVGFWRIALRRLSEVAEVVLRYVVRRVGPFFLLSRLPKKFGNWGANVKISARSVPVLFEHFFDADSRDEDGAIWYRLREGEQSTLHPPMNSSRGFA